MSTADTLYELVKTLPKEQANLVLMFAEFLRQRLQSNASEQPESLSSYFGALEDSPNFNGDSVEIQRAMRREWDQVAYFVISLLKGSEAVQGVLQNHLISIQDCSYSFITRIELLGFPAITDAEIISIEKLLSAMNYVPMSQTIEDTTIQIRREHGLKTPDAIIAATAIVNDLELLTLDQQLANRMTEILSK